MAHIQLTTRIPGPKSEALMQRRIAAVPRGVYASTPLFLRKADGALLEDVDGNRLIDLAGGIGCLNVGHRNPRVLSAIREQLDAFLHLCFQVTGYESYVELAEQMNRITPGNYPKKTLFVNSGAEAIENAVKIARSYTGRHALLCFEDGFHGRTMLGMSLTSKTHPYKNGFGPLLSDVYRIPYGPHAHQRLDASAPGSEAHFTAMLDDVFRRVVSAESVAAVVFEPVLGEGGFVVPPSNFVSALVSACRKHGIVFIADEVQTGFGRTGELFACSHFAIEPDIVTTAKSLGGGLPLAAITGRSEIMDAPAPGGLGGTFGGNPAACAAALAVIREFDDGSLLANAKALGAQFLEHAMEWKKQHAFIGDVRGIGAMQAIELVHPDGSLRPHPKLARAILHQALQRGVLLLGAGTYDNVIRLLMPLSIKSDQFAEALTVLEHSIEAAASEVGLLATSPT